MKTCKVCGKSHDGEHLERIAEQADALGMESVKEFEQHMLEQALCLDCTAFHPDQDQVHTFLTDELVHLYDRLTMIQNRGGPPHYPDHGIEKA